MEPIFRNQIQMISIQEVIPYEQNAKIHSEEQIEEIASLIAKTGWDQPIVVEPDMTIIKGHGRLLAARKLGLSQVPVIVTDLSKEKARAIRLADNKVAEAPWDEELLKLEMAELSSLDDFDTSLTGFDDDEIESILAPTAEELDYSALEGESIQGTVEKMAKSVRKAIQIDFDVNDYEEAVKLAKRLRDGNVYLGGLFLAAMRSHEVALLNQQQ